MNRAEDIAKRELLALEERGLLRALLPLRSRPGAVVELRPGERVINLSSNDYLGLAGDERVARALAEGAARWGAGAGASRLVTGDFTPQHELEAALAAFEESEAAVLFNSGYAANCGLLPVFAGPGDLILSDALNHASIVDACRLSRARVEVYPHGDGEAVERLLSSSSSATGSGASGARPRRMLVVTDTVFSMDGDRAPVEALQAACERHGALLAVDEAHATGVHGPHGLGLAPKADLRMATLSKAVGVLGAHVAGPRAVCELLINRARPLVYSTALPPALACAALAALQIVQGPEGDERRKKLFENIARFAAGLRALGLPARDHSAIFPLITGDAQAATRLAAKLREQGVLAKAIRPPTVPEGTSRLRFALSAAHTTEHLDSALAALRAAL